MLTRAALLTAAALAVGPLAHARADHLHSLYFFATITSIEGAIPIGVSIGDRVYADYFFATNTPDADPSPAIGVYPASIRSAAAQIVSLTSYNNLLAAPITIIDNAALGDIYRTSLASAAGTVSVQIELIDAQSGAFESDANPSFLDLARYTNEFDSAIITIEAPSPPLAAPGSTFRVTAAIDMIQAYPVFCRCDWNQNDVVNSQDFFDFITAFFSGGGDYNGDGITNTQDFFDFLTCFFAPQFNCPA